LSEQQRCTTWTLAVSLSVCLWTSVSLFADILRTHSGL
jgi:hypothetical protein